MYFTYYMIGAEWVHSSSGNILSYEFEKAVSYLSSVRNGRPVRVEAAEGYHHAFFVYNWDRYSESWSYVAFFAIIPVSLPTGLDLEVPGDARLPSDTSAPVTVYSGVAMHAQNYEYARRTLGSLARPTNPFLPE
jgi:hypothetical protein